MSKAATRSTAMSIVRAYSGHQNIIGIPRVYVDLCGDYNRAAVLNQILYWSERTDDPSGWFYKSYDEWTEELGLSRYQIKRAVEGDKRSNDNSQSLVALGVQSELRKAPNGAPTLHYRIDEEAFIKALTATINVVEKPILNNVENGNVNNVDNPSVTMLKMDVEQCCSSFNTKTTTKTTTEKEDKSIASSDAVALPFAEGEGQGRVFLNDETGSTADVSEDVEKDIAPDVDTNKAARGLIAVYLKTTKSVEKNAYKFYMSEAQELTQQNITPAHIAEFIKEKSKDAFWQNQNVTWSHLVKNIIAWRDKHQDKKRIDELPIPEGAQGPNDPTAWMAKPVTTDNASANEAKRSA